MKKFLFILSLYLAICMVTAGRRRNSKKSNVFDEKETVVKAASENFNDGRQGKAFSLFSIVQFENAPCASSMSLTGSTRNRNGTCFTSTECQDKGGSAQGNCAAGFGVCCVFRVDGDTGGTINQNCSYIQNPNFPSSQTAAGTFTYTINKCDDDICSFRLDFETFTLNGIAATDTVDNEGDCSTDTFNVMTSTSQTIPTICGANQGQHIYIDVGANSGDSATVTTALMGAGTRQWDIKVTQVECNSPVKPPDGCLQYSVGLTGRITTFNFNNANENHLNTQRYSHCIRPESGFCCVQYQVCTDQTIPFSLDGRAPGGVTQTALQDDACLTSDHIAISASGPECNQGTRPVPSFTRYCGGVLNPLAAEDTNVAVCDCTAPFSVDIVTDIQGDGGAGIANTAVSRGVCLDYMQIPCT